MTRTPFYHLVPKDLHANLRFRRAALSAGYESREKANELWIMCKRDILFYVNTFCWTYSPKDFPENPLQPFITWEFQDSALLDLSEAIGEHDILAEKSRDMGATWMCMLAIEHRWHFFKFQKFQVCSRKEELVDSKDDEDSLFAKLDFLHRYQPTWLLPRGRKDDRDLNRTKMRLLNPDNRSMIKGEATVDNIGRGGRNTAILLDEHAFMPHAVDISSATRDNTNCRIFNSTPNGRVGVGGEFYRMAHNPHIKKLRFHWSQHPLKAAGAYRSDRGRLELIDTAYWDRADSGYPFILDNKTRSPWYDYQCKKATSDSEIAQEIDIDYARSNSPFVDPDRVQILCDQFARSPKHTIRMDFDSDSFEPIISDDGAWELRLWCDIDEHGKPSSEHDYCVGVDISQGTGSSESVISVGSKRDREKVAEFASSRVDVPTFAKLAVCVCKLFAGPHGFPAYLIFEAQGPGVTFRQIAMNHCGFQNVYYREHDQRVDRKITKEPGFYYGGDRKNNLLTEYKRALFSTEFLNPCETAVRQLVEYGYLPNGRIEHLGAAASEDGSERGGNHGDRVMADALLCKVIIGPHGVRREKPADKKPRYSYNFAERRRERQREAAGNDGW